MLKIVGLGLAVALGPAVRPAAALKSHTEVEIAAPAAAVWTVLTETGAYGDWNPCHVRLDGALREGRTIALTLHKPDGTVVNIRPRVREVAAERRLVWGGGVRGLFRGEHVFELVPEGPGCTRVVQRERFDGVAVRFAPLDGIEEGYERVNAALKARAEALAPGQCR